MGRARPRYVPADDDRCIGLAEAQALLGVHKDTIRRMCLAGALPFQRVGRKYTLRVGDIRAYQERATEAAAEVVARTQQRQVAQQARSRGSFRPLPLAAVTPIRPIRRSGRAA